MERLTVQDLAMFIGCECLINNSKYENIIDRLEHISLVGDCAGSEYEWEVRHCQPILRPLSDMTEEERDERSEFIDRIEKPGNSIEVDAKLTKFLIGKQFDVFRWIEKGLAIDKTKIK
jgi:hypothetical protein